MLACLHALSLLHCRAGLGKEIPYEADSPKELHKLREARNAELLRSLKDSDMSAELMESCRKDQNAGRMAIMRRTSWTSPVPCNSPCCLQERTSGRHSWNYDLPQIRGGTRYRVGSCSHCAPRCSIPSQVPNQMAPERCAQLTTCHGQCKAPGTASEAVVSSFLLSGRE